MEKHTSQYEWDIHFMKEAKLWMERSKCLSRQIGAVLVRGKHVIATGYNGPPSGVPHCNWRDNNGNYVTPVSDTEGYTVDYERFEPVDECPRRRMGFPSGEGMEHCVAVHAEVNPIMQAAKLGISTEGATLYAYCGTPCVNCMKEIIQAGIKRIVCLGKSGSSYAPIKDGDNPAKKDYNFPLSEQLCSVAGIQLDVISEEEINGKTN